MTEFEEPAQFEAEGILEIHLPQAVEPQPVVGKMAVESALDKLPHRIVDGQTWVSIPIRPTRRAPGKY